MADRDTTPSDVPDVLAPGLGVVFCGINPGRVSAAARAHFANPRNDFWRLLHAARFTSRLYEPHEQFALLDEGIGVTNAAYRTTPGSGDLRRGDFAGSAERLEQLARDLRPGWLGFVGKEAYRGTFNERPSLGVQERTLGDTRLFVLPSTSPANAAVPWDERLRWFQELAGRADRPAAGARASARSSSTPAGRTLLLRFGDDHGPVLGRAGRRQWSRARPTSTLCAASCARSAASATSSSARSSGRREHWFRDEHGPLERRRPNVYLVRVPRFEPAPELDLARRTRGVPLVRRTSSRCGDCAARASAGFVRDLLATRPSARAARRGRLAAPAVRDRRAPVAAERLRAQPDAGRRLAALVLGPVDERHRPLHDVGGEAVRAQLLERAVLLDVRLEHPVEIRVRRQRVLVELVGAQLRARRPLDRRVGDQLAAGPLVQVPASRNTSVLYTSFRSANPPAMSP